MLSEGLLWGFRSLGLEAEMAVPEGKGGAGAIGSAACFDSPSWYELTVEGKKAAGSAQTRQKGVVLQHGSILLELDADLLFSLLAFRSEELKERMRDAFVRKAVAINDVRRSRGIPAVGLPVTEEAFREGFSRALDIRLEEAAPTEYERELAERLAVEKYGSDEWTFMR